MTLHFEWFGFGDAARMALAHGLRKEVFVDEQGFSLEADRDEQDKNALHVLGLDETGAARCTARVFADAPGVWHAGRIAVQRGLRGQGVGRLLLAAVADKARGPGARTLGPGYPGGPAVSRAAQTGDSKAYPLPTPHVEGPYNVSFSGLKTAVLNLVNKAQMKGERVNVADMAASFQFRITDILAEKLLLAAQDTGAKQICIAGGVAANGLLRETLAAGAKKLGARLYLPELQLCGDNAAMVAAQGFYEYRAGNTAGLNLNGLATLGIDYL